MELHMLDFTALGPPHHTRRDVLPAYNRNTWPRRGAETGPLPKSIPNIVVLAMMVMAAR